MNQITARLMSFDLQLEEVRFIDQRTKNIVFGYLRTLQTHLSLNNPYYNIPKLVYHMHAYYTTH